MLAKPVRFAGSLLLAASVSTSFAQIPASAAASAAIDVNSVLNGRIITCPQGLRISPQAVCLFATGTVEALKPRVKGKLASRVMEGEDWKTRTGSKNSSLLFRTGNDITYVLLAQADANSVLAIVDAPAGTAVSGQGATQGSAPASTATTPATAGVAYVNARDLSALVSVQAADTVGTFTRLGQSIVVTANNRNARLGTGSVQLAGAPYSAGGQLFVPVTLLRSLGCTVGDAQDGKVTATCGTRSATLNVTTR